MDFTRACELLDIVPPFDMKQLKQHYHKCALKHHPDRNIERNRKVDVEEVEVEVEVDGANANSSEKFQEIGSAYTFLSMWLEAENTAPPNVDYGSILDSFFGVLGEKRHIGKGEMNTLVDNLIHGCRNLSLKAFQDTDKETAVKLFGYITRYSELLGLDDSTILSMREIVREKMRDDQLVILNPSIDNLLKDEVYPLEHNGELFYVPLWHDEISFDMSGSVLVVKCIPDIGEHIHIDEQNVLQVNVTTQCNKVFEDGCVNVVLGEKVFEIPGCELKIQPFQIYTIRSVGVARIDTHDMYSASTKSDIAFNITLTK